MNKEAITYYQEKPRNNEPKDVKIARFSSKLDILQIAGGAVLTPFFPALGIGIMAFNGAEYVGTKAYIKYRMDHHKKNRGEMSVRSESNVPNFRQKKQQLSLLAA